MATLKSLVDETTNIKNEIVECRDILKAKLISKDVEVSNNENRLSVLIDKVDLLINGVKWLYKDGNRYTSVTGGWNRVYQYNPSFWFGGTTVGSILTNTLQMKANKDREFNTCTNVKSIDLTGYSKLGLEVSTTYNSSATGGLGVYIIGDGDTEYSASIVIQDVKDKNTLKNKIFYIDISNINRKSYIAPHAVSISHTLIIHKIWLEK